MRTFPWPSRLLTLSLLWATCLGAGSAFGQEMKLAGSWVVASAKRGGEDFAQPLGDTVVFTDKSMQVKPKNPDNPSITVELKVDTDKKPSEIDLSIDMGGETRIVQGIFAFEGQTLRLCLAKPGDARPSSFESKEGAESVALVLKRAKSE
ncbi:MAG: TIGR03067 domain-containing protein [Pirellulaceae bacterium]